MIIDSSYLIGEIHVPDKTANATVLTQAISEYEPEILKLLLGDELYYLATENAAQEPYKSLIEGGEFQLTFDGETQTLKWLGLKNSAKISLIAQYVFYKYQQREYIKNAGVGTVKPLAEAAEVVSPNPKMIQAWNKMIKLYGETPNSWWYYHKRFFRPDGNLIFNAEPSAYNYMCANIDSFPEWIFTPLKWINPFMI